MFNFITRIDENNKLRQKNFDLKNENHMLRHEQTKDLTALINASSKINGLNRDLARYDEIIFNMSELHPFEEMP